MFEWLHTERSVSGAPVTAEPEDQEMFHRLTEELKKEYMEAESMVSRSEYGLDPDFLFIGRVGHMEFA